MSQDAGADRTVSVDVDGVSVRKAFEAEAFAVPTITFELTSKREGPVEVSLVDRIPEGFPMDGVGFHPEYGSEQWTAYENNRVAFQSTLEPGATIETVYGIRITEPEEAVPFLVDPEVTVTPVGDESEEGDEVPADGEAGLLGASIEEQSVTDLIAEETTGLVREFIRGDREILPGIEFGSVGTGGDGPDDGGEAVEEPAVADDAHEEDAASTEADQAIPSIDLDASELSSIDEPSDEDETPVDVGAPEAGPGPSEPADGEAATLTRDEAVIPRFEEPSSVGTTAPADDANASVGTAEASTGDQTDTPSQTEEEVEGTSTTGTSEPSEPSEPAMTQEIDSSESSTASGTTGPGADVDVDANDGIAAKLAAEIEAGEARDEDLAVVQKAIGGRLSRSIMTQLRHLQSRVSELDAYTDAFASFLDEEGTGRQIVDEMQDEIDAVRSGLDDVRDDVDATDGRLDETRSALDDTAGELGELSEDVQGLGDRLATVTERHDDAIERLEGAVERIEATLEDETDDLEGAIDAVRSDLDELEDGVDDLISWRDQLGEMFSGRGDD